MWFALGLFPWTFPSQVQQRVPHRTSFEATSSQPRRRRFRNIPVVAQDEVRTGVLPNAPEVHPTGPTAVDAASTESIPSNVEDQRMSAGHFDWEERDGASDVEVGFVQEVEPLAVPVRMRNICNWHGQFGCCEFENSFRTQSMCDEVGTTFLSVCSQSLIQVALNELVRGCEASDRTRQIRGWKLFVFRGCCSTARPEAVWSPEADWKTGFDVSLKVGGWIQ